MFVVADESVILLGKPLKELLKIDEFWPFEAWASDLEASDYYSDSVGDLLRQPNKVINTFISQEIQNRTLANFGMNTYDATIEGFEPRAWEPRPFGWYPLPGKPSEVYQRINVQPFPGNLETINFVIGIAEKATASGAVEKGSLSDEKRTLGEIEIAVGKSQERINSMAPFYRYCWERTATKWLQILEANTSDKEKITIYKKGHDGAIQSKKVSKKEWLSKSGYTAVSQSVSQKSANDINDLNKLFGIRSQFQGNPALDDAIRKRALQIANLTPEEITRIDAFEKDKQQQPQLPPGSSGTPGQQGQTPQPPRPQQPRPPNPITVAQ